MPSALHGQRSSSAEPRRPRCCGSIAWSRRARSCAGIVAGGQQVDLPNGVSDVVAEDHLTVEQCADCRNQDTEQEESRRTQPRPDVFISLLTSESGIAADPLTWAVRSGFTCGRG